MEYGFKDRFKGMMISFLGVVLGVAMLVIIPELTKYIAYAMVAIIGVSILLNDLYLHFCCNKINVKQKVKLKNKRRGK